MTTERYQSIINYKLQTTNYQLPKLVIIVFTTYLPIEGFDRLQDDRLVMPAAPYGQMSRAELDEALQDAEVLVTTFDYTVSAESVSNAPRLRLIANFGSGYNNLPLQACQQRGILVTNTPQAVVEPTAEHAFALLHTLAHRTAELDRRLREADYGGIKFGVLQNLGTALYGKTLGIVGMGHIGQALARRAVASGMQIVYHNRHRLPEDIEQQYRATYLSFDKLLQQADVVSLNLPYYPEVHHLIGKAQFLLMKDSALLLNTARGAHVDEEALTEALQQKQIAGAALDVFEHEPDIPEALRRLDNVVLSPHIGTGTWEGRLNMCRSVEENIINYKNNNINLLNTVSL